MTLTTGTSRRAMTLTSAGLLALLLGACGAEVESADAGAAGTRVVNRCGEAVQYHEPTRVVAYEAGSADKMFALGLRDRMLGYVMTPTNPDPATSPYAADYAALPLLSDQLLDKETVVSNKADLVIAGWNSGFSEKRGITPEILDGLGVQSFMHAETCYRYPGFPETHTPIEGLYTDLERLGRIFGVEDRATARINELRERMDAIWTAGKALPAAPKVFLYDSGTDAPSTAGNQVPVQEIIDAAGGSHIYENVAERYTKTSWESVVGAAPDVIMIMSYRDKPAKEKIDFLKSHPALREVPAVKNDKFYVIDYNECISGPRIVDGAERFGAWLREKA